MPLESLSTSDAILHLPNTYGSGNGNPPPLIFFLTGNPGLISYYGEFLASLATPLDQHHGSSIHDPAKRNSSDCIVAGFSLGGFTVGEQGSGGDLDEDDTERNRKQSLANKLLFPPGHPRKEVYSLRDQIDLCYARLKGLVRTILDDHEGTIESGSKSSSRQPTQNQTLDVILAGHSVGAYICLELIRLHHVTTVHLTGQSNSNFTTTTSTTPTHLLPPRFNIISSLLLTPTIINLSHSTSGRIALPLLTYAPFLPFVAQSVTTVLCGALSESTLTTLVGAITGMRRGQGLRTTVSFLRCAGAVKQALAMAGDELREMRGDTWGVEVWGGDVSEIPGAGEGEGEGDGESEGRNGWKAPRLHFLFARRDHWVADVTRDEFVEGLETKYGDGNQFARPVVVIDEEDGLVHAWCLEQSTSVAVRARGWIDEVLNP